MEFWPENDSIKINYYGRIEVDWFLDTVRSCRYETFQEFLDRANRKVDEYVQSQRLVGDSIVDMRNDLRDCYGGVGSKNPLWHEIDNMPLEEVPATVKNNNSLTVQDLMISGYYEVAKKLMGILRDEQDYEQCEKWKKAYKDLTSQIIPKLDLVTLPKVFKKKS